MFGFKLYPNPANIYTIQDGVDGDIYQVWEAPMLAGHPHGNLTITHQFATKHLDYSVLMNQ